MMNSRTKSKTRHLSIIEKREKGDLNFSFELSKIVDPDTSSYRQTTLVSD